MKPGDKGFEANSVASEQLRARGLSKPAGEERLSGESGGPGCGEPVPRRLRLGLSEGETVLTALLE